MSYPSPPLRELRFILHELLQTDAKLKALPRYEQLDGQILDAVLTEFSLFAGETLVPLDALADQVGCTWAGGEVTTPPEFKAAWQTYKELGWPLLCADMDIGGHQLPRLLFSMASESTAFASHAFVMIAAVNHCAAACLRKSASEPLKERWLPALASGEVLSSMCMSEPAAGSDLGLIQSRATLDADGTYRISGSKIFASGAEHDLTSNILHLVLARLPDSPGGTRGLSLFLVPKLNDQGALNGVHCDGLEHKMGLHGSPTCSLRFDQAQGWLVGAPHEGLLSLFPMMNEARLLSALQAIGISEKALQKSHHYAIERRQGRSAEGVAPCRLVDHPDVERMLLAQRAWTEGGRALAHWTATLIDDLECHPDNAVRSEASELLELLTPIAKGFLTENAQLSTSLALQVFGGHGYVRETGIEQLVRDVRITTIYEGTTGIQAQDLLIRKIIKSEGGRFQTFERYILQWLEETQEHPRLQQFTQPLRSLLERTKTVTWELMSQASIQHRHVLGGCTNYLRLIGHLALAFTWTRIAHTVLTGASSDDGWYALKLETARFYFSQLMPETLALEQAILAEATDARDLLTLTTEN